MNPDTITNIVVNLTSKSNYPARYVYMYCTLSNLVHRQKCDSKKYLSYCKECMLLKGKDSMMRSTLPYYAVL